MIGKSSNCIKNGWILNFVLPISSIPDIPNMPGVVSAVEMMNGLCGISAALGPCTLMDQLVFSRNCCGLYNGEKRWENPSASGDDRIQELQNFDGVNVL